MQLAIYFLVGLAAAALFFIVSICLSLLAGMRPAAAAAAAFLLTAPVAYAGHRVLTFRVKGNQRTHIRRFCVATASGFLVTTGLTHGITQGLHWPASAAFLVPCVLVPLVNFWVLKLWVFIERTH